MVTIETIVDIPTISAPRSESPPYTSGKAAVTVAEGVAVITIAMYARVSGRLIYLHMRIAIKGKNNSFKKQK